MDIIEALSLEDTADLVHWNDDPDDFASLGEDQLYWRQAFDVTKPRGKQLTVSRSHPHTRLPVIDQQTETQALLH